MTKKSRITLKEYFKAGEMPTEGDFGDLIDSSLNKEDDHLAVVTKNEARYLGIGTPTPQGPLSIRSNDTNKKAISLEDPDGSERWQVSLKSSGRNGFTIGEGKNLERIFIKAGGNVGIDTYDPQEKLSVKGKLSLRDQLKIRSGELVIDVTANEDQSLMEVSSPIQAPAFSGDGSQLTNITTGVPIGTIVMFHGSEAPEGWALCDGKTEGVPDLRDRFIVGTGNKYALEATGGKDSVQLTKNQLPKHKHSGTTNNDGNHQHIWEYPFSSSEGGDGRTSILGDDQNKGQWYIPTRNDGSHQHNFSTNDVGGNQAHENRPPYYALAFIMRVA